MNLYKEYLFCAEIRKASQCFKSRGIPKVSFGCEPNSMIKIVRAFHGISDPDRPSSDLGNCSPNQGKSTMEGLNNLRFNLES